MSGFEEVVNAYRNDGVSVFITGLNSYLLSGELVTKLTGRYLELDVFPFSLSEVRDFMEINGRGFEPDAGFRDYMVRGGFPRRLLFDGEEEQEKYISDLIDEMISKDVLSRCRVRSREAFERVLRYVMATPSMTVSSLSVSDHLRGQGMAVKPDTVNRYLRYIFDSRLASRCDRYDIVGRKVLTALYNVYPVDPALHTHYPGRRSRMRVGMVLESIVYNELASRGYGVSVGKLRESEVDFVVTSGDRVAYGQVTYVMETEETEEREFGPLLRIADAFPKYVISMDPITMDREGVRHLNLVRDFLLGDGFVL